MTTGKFPVSVLVTVEPADRAGLAVRLRFHSTLKNDFFFTVFTDSDGRAQASSSELLSSFDADREMFLMDYENPRQVFSGRVSASVLSNSELAAKLRAIQTFDNVAPMSVNYVERLKQALTHGQDPTLYRVSVRIS